jgi:hydroxymethylglutaryl-CoA reductase
MKEIKDGSTSEIPGFYRLSPSERIEKVRKFSALTDEESNLIASCNGLKLEQADKMIENVIGAIPVPIGIATNFRINKRDYLVPMAIEEPSVVAAASNAAKMARNKGGFFASNTGPVMVGQIQAVGIRDPFAAKFKILASKEDILAKANEQDPVLFKLGGGAIDLEVRVIDSKAGPMVITHLVVNCKDAMGANAVNTMAEACAPLIEEITGGRVFLRIISNLADKRLVRSRAIFDKDSLGGEDVVDGIVAAYAFAEADPYRCATHNKGIMNGIIAVGLATGQDTRALEAGAHSYAATKNRSPGYSSLTTWEKTDDGDLAGTIELPMAVGLIGGASAVHPVAKACIKILGVKTALELAEVMTSVGLAQNLAALRALSAEGIQRGHMKLHSRNVAISAGAKGDLVDKIAERLVAERRVRFDRAKELLQELTSSQK